MTTKATSQGVRRTLASSRQLSPVPRPRDPADAEWPRPTEPVPVRDAIAEYITKLVADAPLLPAEARAHLAALLADTTYEA